MSKRTILLYGRTGSGKTAQIGELAEHVFATTGKRTRLYTADRGGTDTVDPYIKVGIIEPVVMGDTNPLVFLNKAARGFIRDASGKWVLDEAANAQIGFYAFESLRAIAEAMMDTLIGMLSSGSNIGGGSNISFTVQGDNESIKVGGSNMALFGVVQSRITSEVWQSQKLDADYIMWTSSVSKDEDTTSSGKVLGPDVIGKALTGEVPRWFNLTYRIDVKPAAGTKPASHVIYLGPHIDIGAGNAAAAGNVRLPLDANKLEVTTVEPASIVKALKLIEGGQDKAVDAIKKRLVGKL